MDKTAFDIGFEDALIKMALKASTMKRAVQKRGKQAREAIERTGSWSSEKELANMNMLRDKAQRMKNLAGGLGYRRATGEKLTGAYTSTKPSMDRMDWAETLKGRSG